MKVELTGVAMAKPGEELNRETGVSATHDDVDVVIMLNLSSRGSLQIFTDRKGITPWGILRLVHCLREHMEYLTNMSAYKDALAGFIMATGRTEYKPDKSIQVSDERLINEKGEEKRARDS